MLFIFRKVKTVFVVLVVFLFFVFVFSRGHIYKKEELSYGLTFSQKQAENLGLDWKNVFENILMDLEAKKLRLSAYWDEAEAENGKFFWDDLDWQIEKARQADAKVILAVGGRLPRWPECHFPAWTENLSDAEREEKILNYIRTTIERYKNDDTIVAWQIENEPFLSHFGDCPTLDKDFLDEEIALARSLDDRPIVVTDSGELSFWAPAARRADIFGTTMYRDTYSAVLERYIHYPITPAFFRFKKNLVRVFAYPKDWIVIELQAEPWAPVPYQNVSAEERARTMDLQKFREMLEFARQAGFKEFYLWGAEWWYWEKETQNNPGMWEEAKIIFNGD